MPKTLNEELIRLAYDTLLGSDRFVALSDHLSALSRKIEIGAPNPHSQAFKKYDAHLAHVNELLKHQEDISARAAYSPKNDFTRPSFVIDRENTILSSNKPARKSLNLTPGEKIQNEALIGDEATNMSIGNCSYALVRFHDASTDRMICFIQSNEMTPTGANAKRLTAIDTIWNNLIGDAFAQTFDLSPVELDVVEAIISGTPLRILAKERQRSIETIRTHRKHILTKLCLKSQGELLCLYSGFAHLAERSSHIPSVSKSFLRSENSDNTSLNSTESSFNDANGYRINYKMIGAPSGQPFILFHGDLCGLHFTPTFINEVGRLNLRLIAIWPPHFRQDTGPFDLHHMVETTVSGAFALLDRTNTPPCPALSVTTGAVYGYGALRRAPERFTRLVVVNGAVPLLENDVLNEMKTFPRLGVFTSRHLPAAMDVILRNVRRDILENGGDNSMEIIYQDSPYDLQAINNSLIRKTLLKGFENIFSNGIDGLSKEQKLNAADWQDFVPVTDIPIHFIHGVDHISYPLSAVKAFSKKFSNTALTPLPETGQLALYHQESTILETVAGVRSRPSH